MDWRICSREDGMTVKQFLYGVLHSSRGQITRLKTKELGILKNGERVTVRAVLREGDILHLAIEEEWEKENPHILPRKLPFGVLMEDDAIIVADKPAYMPTHPTHGHLEDTLANALAYDFAGKGIPFVFHAVNRLDRNTSGTVLIAKNSMSAAILGNAMARGEIEKTYWAVLRGKMDIGEGEINRPIKRVQESIITRRICDEGEGAPACTRYRVLSAHADYSIVEAKPLTGRTHQLRVHFASIGHPILGDDLYGTADARIGRQALHARTLSFPHPLTGEPLTVTAPLPEDLRQFLSEDEL